MGKCIMRSLFLIMITFRSIQCTYSLFPSPHLLVYLYFNKFKICIWIKQNNEEYFETYFFLITHLSPIELF